MTFIFLCLASFAAGFIDAIVGGGGLIQTPAILIILPDYQVATLLGTTKIPSFAGTSIAAWQYSRRVQLNYKLLFSIATVAFLAALGGSRMASSLSNHILKPVILLLLIGVAIYTYANKKFGQQEHNDKIPAHRLWYGALLGLIIGFYDGFIGPGTGSFLILVFIAILGQDFLHASAHAKIVNLATNLASILYFSSTGHILYQYALPMAACNITGSFIGTRLALLKGNRFIRIFFLLVVIGTIIRFACDLY
ncbi:sulfite exporter TauE/SafE family protein [Filimonas effusa]|uniref:sulfite exporter TauE/SafE family protein n=1 Tax=Filimonas effusa TaxID=2508721 RepID=UPI001FE961F1|nr:sulfite exporter TauE/SafE family protein [Filimonas effusa]